MTVSNAIEYKRQLTDALEKEMVPFLNYQDGGIIYFRYAQPRPEPSDEKRDKKRDKRRGEKRGGKLPENRRKIVDSMREDPFVTHVRLVELVGIGPTGMMMDK